MSGTPSADDWVGTSSQAKLTLDQLQDRRWSWAIANFGGTDERDMVDGLTEELGEIAHARGKQRQGIRAKAEQLSELEADAVGDLVVYLAGYCSARGFRLQECVEKAWEEVRQRDWVKFPINGRTE